LRGSYERVVESTVIVRCDTHQVRKSTETFLISTVHDPRWPPVPLACFHNMGFGVVRLESWRRGWGILVEKIYLVVGGGVQATTNCLWPSWLHNKDNRYCFQL